MKVEQATNPQASVNLIQNQRLEQSNQVAQTQQANETDSKAADSAKARPRDNVQLSPNVDRMNKANETLKTLPDTRPEKVEAVKAQIEAGQYNVSSRDVAGKMLSTMRNGYGG